MSDPVEQPKRARGRPRLPAEDKKRRNMTFRVRDELRDAVEELAQSKGRSISEQIEYYVEAGVSDEIRIIYEYSNESISDILRKCDIALRHTNFRLRASGDHSVNKSALKNSSITKTDNFKNKKAADESSDCVSESRITLPLAWSQDPAEREGAISMARAMLTATRKGAIDALVATLGSEVVEAAVEEERRAALVANLVKISRPPQANVAKLDPNNLIESMIEEFRKLGLDLGDTDWSQLQTPDTSMQEGDHSLAALVALIGGLTARSPDLSVLWSSSWPRRFADLPHDTRAGLIEALADEAPTVYETMMRPELPRSSTESLIKPDARDIGRGMRMSALRLMQDSLLPEGQAVTGQHGRDDGRARDRG